jgi:hypothetical protein
MILEQAPIFCNKMVLPVRGPDQAAAPLPMGVTRSMTHVDLRTAPAQTLVG